MSKRVHWAFDGTLGWKMNSSYARTSLTSTEKNIMDGDAAKDSEVNFDNQPYLVFNFPGPIVIDALGLKISSTVGTITLMVSSDSTNGQDGSWTEVFTGGYTTANVLQMFGLTALSCTWLRYQRSDSYSRVKSLQIFGEYQAPRFEFWNATASEEFTSNYPLAMASAPNLDDYHGTAQFKLKNTDTVPHGYSLSIKAVRYGGDTVITNNYTLSTNGGIDKASTVTVANIDPGSFSGVIDVFGDVAKAANPADGYHFFVVDVTEIS